MPVLGYKDHENGPALFFKYQDNKSIRFDHFLISHGEKLEASQKLDFLRQIADSIRYSHSKRVIHCSLSPQSILVTNPDDPIPKLQIYNWPISVKQALSSYSRITNVDDVLESQQLVYMAPEALIGHKHISESADVFSLGAIAFHLFANQSPAANTTELSRILVDNKGLKISSIIDGAGQKLEELIQWSTHPDVLTRLSTVDDFLTLLSEVEEELTAPSESITEDPLEAKKGDKLAFGFTVVRDLGQGSTAKALLVTKNDKEKVLKVALKEESNALLIQEAKALESLHSEFIVDFEEILEMNGKTVLVLEKAGDQTLAALLQKDGVLSLDLLCRYGDDLLSALVSLERNGVNHRDIKPDNIGIRTNTKKRNQLILFDFSLTGVPIDNLKVGTEKYKDPSIFSRKPARWDVIAERYSVAVTLHEMALGYAEYPIYGKEIDLPRLTAWYGDEGKNYSYSGIKVVPMKWTPTLLEIKSKIELVSGVIFNSVLLNYYRTGKDSVSWHSDDEPELGKNPPIGSVSFGAKRPFQLKHIENKNLKGTVELTNGSFLLMKGPTQHFWQHQIPKTTKQIGERINLTFRIIGK